VSSFKIHGGKPLSGSIETGYAKNSAVALISASLMTSEPTTLKNVPKIEEVFRFEEIFKSLGIGWEWQNERDLIITPPEKINFKKIDYEAALKTRSIIYLIGALINSHESFTIPRAGGCKLGNRSTMSHFFALEELGMKYKFIEGYYEVYRPKPLKGKHLVMYESGDTTTNNLIMAAALAEGTTEVTMASANYMVQDLCHFLNKMGAKIEGIGSTTLTIHGVTKLKGISYEIMHDPIESMFWISLAATTNSEITIKNCPFDFLEIELYKLSKMNFRYTLTPSDPKIKSNFKLVDITTKQSKLEALDDKIYARPYPGLNIDNLPYFVPIACRAEGRSLIFDWAYENRAIYYLELQKLGANILLADPHRAIIEGPIDFKPNEVICPPALRPATMLLCAMLQAKGTSILRNTYPIDRGHEDIYERLRMLGADIEEI